MSLNTLTTIEYKKGNWMRYTLWGLAAVCVFVLVAFFLNAMNESISVAVPSGYRFAVADDYKEGNYLRTTYYVYNNRVIVENERFRDGDIKRTLLIYDNIDTALLEYDPDDVIEVCESGTCHNSLKVLVSIKKMLSQKMAREYTDI